MISRYSHPGLEWALDPMTSTLIRGREGDTETQRHRQEAVWSRKQRLESPRHLQVKRQAKELWGRPKLEEERTESPLEPSEGARQLPELGKSPFLSF